MITSPSVGSAAAAVGSGASASGDTTRLSTSGLGPTAPALDQDEIVNATDGVGIWEGAILTLRADESSGEIQLENANWNLDVNTNIDVDADLNKDPVAIYDTGTTITLTFDNSRAGANKDLLNTPVQLIAARLEGNQSTTLSSFSSLEDLKTLVDTESANENASFTLVTSTTLDSGGDKTFTYTPSEPGQYVLFLATNESGGFSVDESTGNITRVGETTIVGADHLAVQRGRSTVTTDKSTYGTGEDVTFTADTSTDKVIQPTAGENVTHAVVLYDEETFVDETFNVNVTGDFDSDFNVSENVTLGHTIARVNGVGKNVGNASAFGISADGRRTVGLVTFQSILDYIAENTSVSNSLIPKDSVTGSTIWNASMTVKNGTADDTIVVETRTDWPSGEYRWVHLATNESGTEFAADTGTVTFQDRPATFEFVDGTITITPQTALDTEPVTVKVDLENVGEGAGTQSVNLQLDGSVFQSQDVTLNASEQKTVTFTLAAGTVPAGSHSLNVTVDGKTSNTGSLTVNEASPDITVNTTTLNYNGVGATPGGTTQSVKYVNVTNNGSATLALDSLQIEGTGSDQFEITDNGTAADLEPGESRIVAVAFRPTQRGAASATLRIGSSAPSSPTNVSLSGTGQAPAFILNTSSPLTFGTKNVGTTTTDTVDIRNDGNQVLSITNVNLNNIQGNAFSYSNDPSTIAADGGTGSITVTFNPSDGGTKTASLTITTNDSFTPTRTITLGGSATQRSMAVAPSSVDFGNVTWGGENGSARVAVENTGTVSLTIEPKSISTTGPGDLTVGVGSFSLGAGKSRFVPLELNATGTGAISGQFTLDATNAAGVSKTVTISATGRKADITASPTSLDFGESSLAGSTLKTVDIGNSGDATLTVNTTSAFNSSEDGNFSLVGAPDSFEVAPGGTQTLTVAYSPTVAGTANATLTLQTNDPDAGDTIRNVSVGGVGVQTEFEATQSSVDFGSVANGTTSSQQTVTIENPSATDITITGVQISGTNADQFSNGSLSSTTIASGGSVTLPVTFSPTSGGAKSATLSVTADTDEGSQTISLTLSGSATTPRASFAPLTVPAQLGYVNVDGGSSSASVRVRNTGPSGTTLRITDVSISNSVGFTSSSTPDADNPITVSSGSSKTIPIKFDPTTSGAKSATLTLTTNDPNNPTITAKLLGVGSAPKVSLSTSSLSFGQVGTGFTAQRTVSVTNVGGAPLTIGSGGLTISGTDSGKFKVVGSPTPRTVVPGGTARFTVEVEPTASGSLSATLDIASNAASSPDKVSLSATGITPTLEATDADDSTLANASTLNYDDTPRGSAETQTISIENTGQARLRLPAPSLTGSDSGAYSITSGQGSLVITPGSTEQYTVAFAPTSTGSKSASLVFDGTNDPGNETYVLELSGTGTTAEARLDPAAVSFGAVDVDSSETESVTLRNTGSAEITVSSVSISGADSGVFSAPDSLEGQTVAAGGTHSFDLTATPTVRGGAGAKLAITVKAGTTSQTVTASLGATGTAPNVELKQVPVDMGSVLLGNESTETIYVNNTGNADLSISDVTITGDDASAFSIAPSTATVEPTDSQALTVTFAPTDNPAHEGSLEATIEVDSDDPDTATITRNVTGVGETPNVTVSPSALQFGTVALDSSVTRNVTITNELSGTANVTVDDIRTIAVPNFDSDAYSVSDPSPFTLVPGQSKRVEVTFTPTSSSPAQKFAWLAVSTEDPRVGTRNVWLSNSDLRIELIYGSVNATYFDPDPGVQPEVDLSQNLDRNATLETLTVATSGQTGDFYVKFDTSATKFQNALPTGADVPLQYINVTESVTATNQFENATIEFAVKKSVMSTYGLETGDISLQHYDGSYSKLDTTKVNETQNKYVFSATTEDFSEFVVSGEQDSDTFSLEANHTSIDEGQAIKFTVKNSSDSAVEDATVTVEGGVSGTTNASGVVVLTPEQLGTHDVTVTEDDDTIYFEPLTKTDFISVRTVVNLDIAASSTSVDEGDDVTFTVTNADSESAIEDATVSFAGNSGTADASGNVTLSADQSGDAVTATASKSQNATARFVSDSVDVDVEASPSGGGGAPAGGGGAGGGGGGGGGAPSTPAPGQPSSSTIGRATVTASTSNGVLTANIQNSAPGDEVTIRQDDTAIGEGISQSGAALEQLELDFVGETDFDVQVTASADNPDPATPDPPEDVRAMGYLRVDHDASDDAIGEVRFTFRVTQERLEQRGVSNDEVVLYRYSDGEWTALETQFLGTNDDGTLRFRATSPGLSVFAIGGRQAGVTTTTAAPTTTEEPTTTTEEPETTTEAPTATTAVEEPAGFDVTPIVVVGLLVVVVLGYLYYRRREE